MTSPTRRTTLNDYTTPDYSPRRISKPALRALRESLQTYGDLSGVVVNRRTGHIVCANQRRSAIGTAALANIEWDDPQPAQLGYRGSRFKSNERRGTIAGPGGATIAVREVDWPLEFEKAASIAANNPEIQGEFTPDLQALIASIKDDAGESFEDLNFDKLLRSIEDIPPAEGKADPDEIIEPANAKPKSQPGHIYALGEHRLLCGSATDRPAVAALCQKSTAALTFTDPPYNMDYRSKSLGGIKNDAISKAAFVSLILESCHVMATALMDGGSYYICMSGIEYPTVCTQLRRVGLRFRPIVWVKPHSGLGAQDYRPQFEIILYGISGDPAKRTWHGARRQSDVWEFVPRRGIVAWKPDDGGMALEFDAADGTEIQVLLDQATPGTVVSSDGTASDVWHFARDAGAAYRHPTQKPVELIERAIRNSSDEADIVLDLFGGSGSTLIACERTGRIARLVELDPRYCDVIRQRYARFTNGPDCDWEEATPSEKEV